jgi:thioredoxin-like negative regulator of GroEL
MVSAESTTNVSEDKPRVLIRSGHETYAVSPEKALALAHLLAKAKRYKAALQVCQKVVSLDAKDPQAVILMACCEAGLKDYEGCNKILRAMFSGNQEVLAEHLQAAFVYHTLGMNSDSAKELVALTDEQPDLPMVWLLLGDHLSEMGKQEKAALCWRLAIDRAGHRGAAALAAERELESARNC